jgi:hypothetical protein
MPKPGTDAARAVRLKSRFVESVLQICKLVSKLPVQGRWADPERWNLPRSANCIETLMAQTQVDQDRFEAT